MTTSRTRSFLSEIASGDSPIPVGKLAYFQERWRNSLYSYIIKKFREHEKRGLTKAQLARRIGYDPARITRLLNAPGNWTLDTASDLLVGIAAEELVPASLSLLNRPPRNFAGPEWLRSSEPARNVGPANGIIEHFERFPPDRPGEKRARDGLRDLLVKERLTQ